MKNKTLKIFISILVFVLGVNQVDAAKPRNVDNWASFAGNTSNSKTTNTKTIRTEDDIDEKTIRGSFREPIIVNNKIYIVNAAGQFGENTNTETSTLDVYDFDGKLLQSQELGGEVGFFSRLTYGDNKIFVPLKEQIQAFDVDTLRPLWISKKETGQQMISSLTYYNGYVYSGSAIPRGATTQPADGFFFALSTKDEDPNKTNELKNYAWTWEKDKGSGFYWANAAIVKNSIVFVGDGGQLVSHHLTRPEVYDEYNLASKHPENKKAFKVRSSIYYDTKKDELIIGTQNSAVLFSVMMNGNKFNTSNIKSVNAVDEISGGIAATDNRIYVPSGGMNANAFSIYDRNLNLNYENDNYGTQSYPLVSTGYGKDKYIYFIDYKSGQLIIVKDDNEGKPTLTNHVLKTSKAYNSNGIIANGEGDLIVPNYGGSLAIIKNKNKNIDTSYIEQIINELPGKLLYTDKDKIEYANNRYNNFIKDNPNAKVSNVNVLKEKTAEYKKIVEDKIKTMIEDINTIPASFSDDETLVKVTSLEVEYHKLYTADKALVTNYDKLQKAIDIANDIFDEVKVPQIIDMINKLPKTINLDSEKPIKDITKIYVILGQGAKDKVTNYERYIEVKTEVEKQRKEVDGITKAIMDLPFKLTFRDQAKINGIVNRYNKLTAVNKKYINSGDYKYLIDCRNEVNRLVTAETNRKNSVIKSGNTTNYYKKYGGVWYNYKRVIVKKNVTTTYSYKYAKKKVKQVNPRPNNGSQLTRKDTVTRKGKTITRRQIINYNNYVKVSSNNIHVRNKKKKLVNTYRNTRSYYKNKRVKQSNVVKRNKNTKKVTYKQTIKYKTNGKRKQVTTYKLKKKKLVKSVKKYR